MAAFKPNPINYILGLDIGIASVGWAMVEIDEDENPICLIDLGVRVFERAEVPKTGDSLAAARRLARSVRRLTRRRAHRLLRARRLLKREGVLQAADFDENGLIKSLPNTPWQLRSAALDRKLTPLEWSAVLLHLIKHRGYLSQRKSGKEINLGRLNEKGYVEIDHALPFSRTWDDSFNNKVLVLGSENQNKGNQTPYEYFNGKDNSREWQEFKARVETSRFPRSKKQRILLQKFDEDGFKERNLNDTRYVNRFLCQFVADRMRLTGKGKKRVFASNGQITNLLRGFWGLRKVRAENDRHHALDAVVVACSTVAMQQKITRFVRYKEMNAFDGKTIDKETGEVLHQKTHFPQPWEFFAQEVMIRVFGKPDGKPEFEEADTPEKLRTLLAEKLSSRPEAVHEYVTPLFVSRAPNRKMSGQGHMETVKSAKRLDEGVSVLRVPLTQLKLKDLEKMVNREREPKLYEALKARLEAHKDDPAKAFAEPFYKYDKAGNRTQQVKAVRVEQVQKTGVWVRNHNGIADNATMVRVDVFEKGDKYYLVPIYSWQVAKGILPDRAVVAYADEEDWTVIDESFRFKFVLYSNDLIKVQLKKDSFLGYFSGLDRATGAISLREHDLEKSKGKDGMHRIGVKTALSFQKYQIDEMGKEIRPCRLKKRPPVR